ncbi:hypothetical protein C8N46_10342 [Kordia periserrulae]|uniref:Uncharacterized protein n=1 Tax=Kordia periserrulae TaxID=701523 RepID=A0A2T6C0V0_9FLAO|nr:hypothetical protein C8N46_10342 [Kordia periserrulae]
MKKLNLRLQNYFCLFFVISAAISGFIGRIISDVFDIHYYFIFPDANMNLVSDIFMIIYYISALTYLYFMLRKIRTSITYSIMHLLSTSTLFFYGNLQPFDYKTILILQTIATATFFLNVYYTFKTLNIKNNNHF